MRFIVPVVAVCLGAACTGGGSRSSDGGVRSVVFVTSTLYTGDLGGLVGADEKCATAASAAELPGTFLAYLSTATADAPDRMTGTGPWFRTDGTKAFNNKANLSTQPAVGIDRTENGDKLSETNSVWTGTSQGGTASGADCAAWTSNSALERGTMGGVGTTTGWAQDSGLTFECNVGRHLYCFQQ